MTIGLLHITSKYPTHMAKVSALVASLSISSGNSSHRLCINIYLNVTSRNCLYKLWCRAPPQTRCQKIFQVQAPVNAVMLHPDQSQIMVGDQSGIIHMWDLKTDQNDQLVPEAEASIQDIAIDPAGKMMAAVNNKGNCYVWALGGQAHPVPRKHIAAHHKYALRCKFSRDSTMLVTTSGDCSAKVWRTSDWTPMRELRHETQRWVWDAAFSIDSRFLFTGNII
ncbi:hypothetical protein O3G_MSEX003392 [Manduca sexta]|uniref:Target of rapamycin complex subunit lst8 n=1 Tax=Manduca sexta TaxID=7130 RepID=A0A921YSA6_MANSE|nr:hypothetical protein O3G_MSEX003392 [Manduca sexta]